MFSVIGGWFPVFTLASAATLLYGVTRGFLVRLCRSKTHRGGEIDVIIKRSFRASAVMAGRGDKQGSFGGIGTSTSFGGADRGGYRDLDSSSR